MTEPLCTIVISSYNRPRLIRDALDSALAQTWPNVQIIIADDWSDAATTAVLEEYYEREPKVHASLRPLSGRPTAQQRQFGQRTSVCINAVMKFVEGDFVAFLPDDDFLPPNSLEVRARYLVEHPEVNCVYGRLEACHVVSMGYLGLHHMEGTTECDFHHWVPEGYSKPMTIACHHDRNSFYSAEPIIRAANKVDHGMMMVRRVPHAAFTSGLPRWPLTKTWSILPGNEGGIDEQFDCPDAGWFHLLECSGLGPFHSVPDFVVVKRYHPYHHRTDPMRRE